MLSCIILFEMVALPTLVFVVRISSLLTAQTVFHMYESGKLLVIARWNGLILKKKRKQKDFTTNFMYHMSRFINYFYWL